MEETSSVEELDKQAAEIVAQTKVGSEDIAAQMFKMYSPRFLMLLDQLPLKAAIRVVSKLVTYPLNDKEYKGQTEMEKEVFALGDRLLQAKYMMIIHTFFQNDELKKKMQDKVEQELVKEGEKNG